jgi:hypothetical protein
MGRGSTELTSPGCYICFAKVNPEDGSPVLWKCRACGRTVCRRHTLTIPGRKPAEYYADTLCSLDETVQAVDDVNEEPSCWEKAGRPEE